MRTAPLLIALFLLAGAAALAYVPAAAGPLSSSVPAGAGPGSFPLAPSFQWPAKLRSAPFQPSKGIGSDALAPSPVVHDAKTRCLNECPSLTPASSKLPFASA